MNKVTRLDYCQYLLSSPINYTLTHKASHSERFSHDMINRSLSGDRITPHLVWENVSPYIIPSDQGFVIFDDTVLDQRYSFNIALVRRQYSGNAHGVIKGIGVVTCVYVNPVLDRFWIIDYRIYDEAKRAGWQDQVRPCAGDAVSAGLSQATTFCRRVDG